jgi:hypothetical protein
VPAASIISAIFDDGGSKHLWNASKLLPDDMAHATQKTATFNNLCAHPRLCICLPFFFLVNRQTSWPEVISGAQCCNNVNWGHCWSTMIKNVSQDNYWNTMLQHYEGVTARAHYSNTEYCDVALRTPLKFQCTPNRRPFPILLHIKHNPVQCSLFNSVITGGLYWRKTSDNVSRFKWQCKDYTESNHKTFM